MTRRPPSCDWRESCAQQSLSSQTGQSAPNTAPDTWRNCSHAHHVLTVGCPVILRLTWHVFCRVCRSRELSELRAHLAEEKGTLEAVRKEVNNTDQRAHKQVRPAHTPHHLTQPASVPPTNKLQGSKLPQNGS
jgi:hypothetical protein